MADLLTMMKKQKSQLTKLQTLLKKILASQPNPADRVNVLRKELPRAEKILKDIQLDPVLVREIRDELVKARTEFETKETELRQKFGAALAESLKQRNFSMEGNFPKFQIAPAYTITVEFPDKAEIWFGAREKLATTKTIPEEIAATLVKHHEAITTRPFDEKLFLRTLKTAYQMYLLQAGRPPGTDAPLPAIHTFCSVLMQNDKFRRNPVRENLTEYTRAMFSYDLARIRVRIIDQSEMKLSTATMSETTIPGNCFWIPPYDATPSGTYARLKFTGTA